MKEKVLVIQLRRPRKEQRESFYLRIDYLQMRNIQDYSSGRTVAQALSEASPFSIDMGVIEIDSEQFAGLQAGKLRVNLDSSGHKLIKT